MTKERIRITLDNVPVVHLLSSQCVFATRPTVVSTVLGSCIALTMFDPRQRIGAMCHAFLPTRPDRRGSGAVPEDYRYVDTAVAAMLDGLKRRTVLLSGLEIKLFGGAHSRDGETASLWERSVGGRNVAMAREILSARGLSPLVEDVGGLVGRKVIFLAHTGGVWIKRLSPLGTAEAAGSVVT